MLSARKFACLVCKYGRNVDREKARKSFRNGFCRRGVSLTRSMILSECSAGAVLDVIVHGIEHLPRVTCCSVNERLKRHFERFIGFYRLSYLKF